MFSITCLDNPGRGHNRVSAHTRAGRCINWEVMSTQFKGELRFLILHVGQLLLPLPSFLWCSAGTTLCFMPGKGRYTEEHVPTFHRAGGLSRGQIWGLILCRMGLLCSGASQASRLLPPVKTDTQTNASECCITWGSYRFCEWIRFWVNYKVQWSCNCLCEHTHASLMYFGLWHTLWLLSLSSQWNSLSFDSCHLFSEAW